MISWLVILVILVVIIFIFGMVMIVSSKYVVFKNVVFNCYLGVFRSLSIFLLLKNKMKIVRNIVLVRKVKNVVLIVLVFWLNVLLIDDCVFNVRLLINVNKIINNFIIKDFLVY